MAGPRPKATRVGIHAAVFAVLVGVVVAMMALADRRMPDDAFIFYRYARHIVDGHGWVYNVGSTTANAATSPLWTVVLSAGAFVTRDVVFAGAALYALCLAGAAHLTGWMLWRRGRPVAGAGAALLLVVNPALLGVRGMESALLLLLCAAFLAVALDTTRVPWDGVLGGLLTLVRPEGALLVGIVFVHRWWSSRVLPWRSALAALGVLVPWVAFSTAVFGSPVSETLAAKTAQGRSGFFGPPFVFVRYLRTMAQTPWSALLMAASAVGLVLSVRRRELRLLVGVVVAFVALDFVLYALVVRPPAYLWYYALADFALAVLAALGVDLAVDAVGARWRDRVDDRAADRAAARPRLAPASAMLLVVVLVGVCIAGQDRGDLYEGYASGARWLRDHAEPTASVSAAEIGSMGWNSGRPIVDFLGLLSEQSADEVGRGDLASWLGREQPDYFVAHVPLWDMEAPAASRPGFAAAYRPVFESVETGWSQIRIFERVAPLHADRAGESVVLTDTVVEAFGRAGVALDASERLALAEALGVYVGSARLQQHRNDGGLGLELAAGVDLAGLVRWAAADASLEPSHRRVLGALGQRIGTRPVVSPLAPRGGA